MKQSVTFKIDSPLVNSRLHRITCLGFTFERNNKWALFRAVRADLRDRHLPATEVKNMIILSGTESYILQITGQVNLGLIKECFPFFEEVCLIITAHLVSVSIQLFIS